MRSCLFCSEHPSTKEDAWPTWLVKRFPVSTNARMFMERAGVELPDWPVTRPRLALKWLCAACNNGWMSRLEAKAKPIIESLLEDTSTSIDPAPQVTLATWAVKTAMVLEAFYPDRAWFFSAEERAAMRLHHRIPSRTSVWLAKCVNQRDIYSAGVDLGTGHGPEDVRGFAVTMAFGSIAFQVMTARIPARVPSHVAVTYGVSNHPWPEILVDLSPASEAAKTWPPKYGLDSDHGLQALTDRFNAPRA